MPVIIEGTPPESDPRLNHLKVTPDPGVIEVNLQPAHSWDGARPPHDDALRRSAPDAARHREVHARRPPHRHRRRQPHRPRRRDAGRQPVPAAAGSAAQPGRLLAQSPVAVVPVLGAVHRPDQPASARRRRRGTTRCTSSRSRSRRSPARGESPPWLVDRVFRNLLVDVTGNTHRAEFCIDKLYSPDTSSGRLGLVELRAFEMPPHAHMSLAQQLLLRALVARFWKTPYNQTLVRWDTELHDRFMLPHFVGRRFRRRPRRSAARPAIALQPEWFAPHFEFRFPVYGSVTRAGRPCRTAAGARAVARARRGAGRRRRRALCRFVGRAAAGQGHRHDGIAPFRCLQRPLGAAASDRHGRRVRRRRPLPRLAAAELPAPDHPRARAARLRSRRRVERTVARRLHLSRRAPGRAQLRDVSGQRLRSRRPPARALLRDRPHAGADERRRRGTRDPDFPLTLDLRRPIAPSVTIGTCLGLR